MSGGTVRTRTQSVNLFDLQGQPVAAVDITYEAGAAMPNVITFKGRTFASVLGAYREAKTVSEPPESKPIE